MSGSPVNSEEITALRRLEADVMWRYWSETVLFSLNWWLMIVITAAVWIFWWRIVDRRRFTEITFFGLVITLMVLGLDTIGTDLNLWAYPYTILPLVPAQLGVDLAVLPVLYMHLYQHSATLKEFGVRLVILAAFASFVAAPIAEWLGIYQMLLWRHIYSFPIYIAVGFLAWWVIVKALRVEQTGKG